MEDGASLLPSVILSVSRRISRSWYSLMEELPRRIAKISPKLCTVDLSHFPALLSSILYSLFSIFPRQLFLTPPRYSELRGFKPRSPLSAFAPVRHTAPNDCHAKPQRR